VQRIALTIFFLFSGNAAMNLAIVWFRRLRLETTLSKGAKRMYKLVAAGNSERGLCLVGIAVSVPFASPWPRRCDNA